MESVHDLRKRAIEVLNKYKNNNVFNNIVMVSNGALINTILAILSKHTIGIGKTKLKNDCINLLNCTSSSIKIELYNFTAQKFIKVVQFF